MYASRSDCIGKNVERRMRGQAEQTCTSEQEVSAAFASGPSAYTATIVPVILLVVAWVLGGITWGLSWWIRRGFRTLSQLVGYLRPLRRLSSRRAAFKADRAAGRPARPAARRCRSAPVRDHGAAVTARP